MQGSKEERPPHSIPTQSLVSENECVSVSEGHPLCTVAECMHAHAEGAADAVRARAQARRRGRMPVGMPHKVSGELSYFKILCVLVVVHAAAGLEPKCVLEVNKGSPKCVLEVNKGSGRASKPSYTTDHINIAVANCQRYHCDIADGTVCALPFVP